MSAQLWQAYYNDDLPAFRRLLASAPGPSVSNSASTLARGPRSTGTVALAESLIGGGSGLGTSPVASGKSRRAGGTGGSLSGGGAGSGGSGNALTRTAVNARDATGQTLLHHIASSNAENAVAFAAALVEHPLIDLYLQDAENGWTALHRAFYFGNVTLARMILERDANDVLRKTTGHGHHTTGLIKIKDREGHGPLDLYAATIKDRTLRPEQLGRSRAGSQGSEDNRAVGVIGDGEEVDTGILVPNIKCDQLYTFGSNKNVTLGFGDEDDRQFPERINIRRPDRLLRRFYTEHFEQHAAKWTSHDPGYQPANVDVAEMWADDIPWVVRGRPLIIQDVQMSKLHSAVLTTDPECNLYICGHGQGGRLGTGDELTRFHFVCIEGAALAGKKVASVALGLNHTLALSAEGDIFSWGNNGCGQLGYSLPRSANDDEPISLLPRQIFGILKRETVIGIAASRTHSVAYTGSSLFTFGKNEGQLGIMDSDARSLEIQVTPRKVAASLFASAIISVAAMEKATVCLLESHDVWVFANYGYAKVQFPLEGFTNYFLKQSFLLTSYDHIPNRIIKLTCGGDTICVLSSRGEIYTISMTQRLENPGSASTTNPSKIKSAIPAPQRIWSPKKRNMAARDVAVDADGSIILSTEEGSVWKRTKRATIKSASASGTGEYKPKDYKFSRMPGLTRVLAVRASAHGAYAAVRRDCDVTQTQIVVENPTLWNDIFELCSLRSAFAGRVEALADDSDTRHRFWQTHNKQSEAQLLRRAIMESKDVEAELDGLAERVLMASSNKFDAVLCTSTSSVQIPVHRFILTARSRVMRRGFRDLCETSTFTVPDLAVSELNSNGHTVVQLQGLDILTVLNLVYYLYTDGCIDFWHFTRSAPQMAFRYRQVRTELMKVATKLELSKLEPAARQMVEPRPCLDMDMEVAYRDPAFFYDGDIIVRLEDDEVRVHSALVCARCPFFEGLFMGRAGGRWLLDRDAEEEDVTVDLEHINARTFTVVLRHIYADTGTDLFDDTVSVGLDDFLDFVMDVMSAANELMLDRLSQISQQVVGRFVNVRNVCGLLNAISPSSVPEFKDAALEYLCLSLEAMLQGHHLNELEEDLLTELDSVVRQNQLGCMPFAKSSRAELLLHERHPELAATIERSRQARIDAITLRAKFHELSRVALGSAEDTSPSTSPLLVKSRRRSSHAKPEPDRPTLKAKASSKDMVFAMDDDIDERAISQPHSPSIRPTSASKSLDQLAASPQPDAKWYDSRGKLLPSPGLDPKSLTPGPSTPRTARSPNITGDTPPSSGVPWSLTPLSGPRVDMKGIMAQAESSRTSALSQALASPSGPISPASPTTFSLPAPKMSQKDRKRMQRSASGVPQTEEKIEPSPASSPTPAWQTVGGRPSASIKDILGMPKTDSAPKTVSPSNRAASTPQLTMRQTVANNKKNTQSSKQSQVQTKPDSHSRREAPEQTTQSPITPLSIRHNPPVPEPILGLSMSEIVAAQQLEKDVVREAAAKRDLQDIQAEQEFEEWWQRESARVQEAEQRNAAAVAAAAASNKSSAASKRNHRPRGKRIKPANNKSSNKAADGAENANPAPRMNAKGDANSTVKGDTGVQGLKAVT